jgi:ATP-dependent Zn protease
LLERAQATCQVLLRDNRAQLDALAQRLLEREVVSGEELEVLLGPRKIEAPRRAAALPPIPAPAVTGV